jgi:hypothetical protein
MTMLRAAASKDMVVCESEREREREKERGGRGISVERR